MRDRYPNRQRAAAVAGILAVALALTFGAGTAFADDDDDVPLDTKMFRRFMKELGFRNGGAEAVLSLPGRCLVLLAEDGEDGDRAAPDLGVDRTLGAIVAEHHFGIALLLAGFLVVFSILPLAAAAAGFCRAVRDPAGALCVALVVSTLLVHIPMWIEYRYWLPVLPYELALAAAGASAALGRWRRRGQRRLATAPNTVRFS